MSSFLDVFGAQTVPPSQFEYVAYTTAVDNDFFWPEQYSGTGLLLASITEINPTSSGVELDLPDATAVSVGRDFLIINVGANLLTIRDTTGGAVATVASGIAKYFYLTDNSTAAGSWSVLTYGAGTNTADAAALAGLGLQASGITLETNNLGREVTTDYIIPVTDRAHIINVTSGTITLTMPQASVAGEGFWVGIRNSSIGSVIIEGYLAETIDDSLNKTLGPNESAMFFDTGSGWITVGYGRDVNFVFTEYVVNAAVGNVTLSSSDVSGRMIRVSGTAAANFIVTLPTIDNIYFVIVESGMGGFTVEFKTAIGTGVTLSANQNVALYSDGTNINFAVTTAAVSSIDLNDGSAVAPSLRFLLDADTGIFRAGANTLGVTAGGVQVAQFNSNGLTGSVVFTPVGTIAATTVAGALAELDGDIQGHITDPTDAHDASAISSVPAGTLAATDVQAALNELDTEKAPLASPVFTGNPTAPTPAVGDDDTSIATTEFVMNAYADGFGGGGFSFKNKIINGAMQVAQRLPVTGTSRALTTGVVYGPVDRWTAHQAGTADGVAQQNTLSGEFQFAFKLWRNAGSAQVGVISSRYALETKDSYWARDKSVTLSLYIQAGANFSGANVRIRLVSGTGTDQSASTMFAWTGVTTPIDQNQVIGGLARYSFTGTVPANTTQLGIDVSWTPTGVAGADDAIYFTGVQLEEGDEATPFEHRGFSTELAFCQRYYEKSFGYPTTPAQNAGVSGAFTFGQPVGASASAATPCITFRTSKRTVATMTLYNPSAANAQIRNTATNTDWSGSGTSGYENSADLSGTTPAATAAGQFCRVHWAADAEL